MTRDDIIKMAIEARLPHYWESGDEIVYIDRVTHFAKLVAQHEREEIAQFIEQTNLGSLPDETALHYAQLLKSYSTAIRARGTP